MGFLPDWLQKLADECTEGEAIIMTSEREMRYRAAQAERGQKMVRVWVPVENVEELKEIAKKMREASILKANQEAKAYVSNLIKAMAESGASAAEISVATNIKLSVVEKFMEQFGQVFYSTGRVSDE